MCDCITPRLTGWQTGSVGEGEKQNKDPLLKFSCIDIVQYTKQDKIFIKYAEIVEVFIQNSTVAVGHKT